METNYSNKLKRTICAGIIAAYATIGFMGIKYAIDQSKKQPEIKQNQTIEQIIATLQQNNLEKITKNKNN